MLLSAIGPGGGPFILNSLIHFFKVNTFCHLVDATTNATTFGYCSSSHDCQTHAEVTGLSSTSWVVGLIVFLVCYVIILAIGIWIYCRYCRGSLRRNRAILETQD